MLAGALLCLLGLAGGSIAAPSTADGPGHVEAVGPLDLTGGFQGEAEAWSFSLQAPDGPAGHGIEAGRVHAETSWSQGWLADQGGTVQFIQTDSGTTTWSATNASLHLAPWQETPEVVGIAKDGARLEVGSIGDSQIQVVEDPVVVAAGWNEEGQASGTGQATWPGFWHQPEGPHLHHSGIDDLNASGEMRLFVNNVTLTASSPDTTREMWTGLWINQTGAGPGPGVGTYHARITVLTLDEARVSLQAPGTVELYTPRLQGTMEGSATAAAAVGQLHLGETIYRWDGDPFTLQGRGILELWSPADPSLGDPPERAADERGPAILPGEGLEVHATPGLQVQEDTAGSGVWPGALAAAGVLVVAGAAVGLREPVQRLIAGWTVRRREERVTRWLRTGDRLFQAREFEDAMSWYQRIIHAYPNSLEGWNSVATCYEELGEPSDACQAYLATLDLMADDDPHLIARAALAAWRAGDTEQAVSLLKDLIAIDPEMARARVDSPGFAALRQDHRIQDLLRGEDQDVSSSYA